MIEEIDDTPISLKWAGWQRRTIYNRTFVTNPKWTEEIVVFSSEMKFVFRLGDLNNPRFVLRRIEIK